MFDYPQSLRSIGQALEALQAEEFSLELDGESFRVRCAVPRPAETASAEPEPAMLLRHIWGILPDDESLSVAITLTGRFRGDDLDLLYTADDVQRLDDAGKAKRGTGNTQANLPRVSQCLRTVGAYIQEKPARLLSIARSGDDITVTFETPEGERQREVLSLVEVYDLSVSMYMRRGERDSGSRAR